MEHHFKVEDAIKYGVDKAVLLYNLRFWLIKNRANRRNIFSYNEKDYYWTYNSSTAYAELFPYMNDRSIRRHFVELEKMGVVISGNFNKKNYDQTKWYSMNEFEVKEEASDKMTDGETQNDRPIPDIKPDTYISNAEEKIQSKDINVRLDCFIEEFYDKQERNNPEGTPYDVYIDRQTHKEFHFGKIWKLFELYEKKNKTIKKAAKTRETNDSTLVRTACKMLANMQRIDHLDGGNQGKYINSIISKIRVQMIENKDEVPENEIDMLAPLQFLLEKIRDKSKFDWENMYSFSYLDKWFQKITRKVL